MTNLPRNIPFRAAASGAALAIITMCTGFSSVALAKTSARQLPDRLAGPIDNTSRAALLGSTPPRAMRSTDLGAIDPNTELTGISLVFSRSAQQEADLDQLIAAQQNPSSPVFHQWLTPAQFGARFGISDNDLATTESWLQSQGFSILAVSPSRESLTFSGRESAVESAFGAPLHYFRSVSGSMTAARDPLTHVAPAHDLTLPTALSSIVLSVGNLSDYHAQSHSIRRPTTNFTSAQSGSHYLTPKDVATIYDINAAYNAGYSGAGQTIVVAGESAVVPADITNFQTAAGVATNTPNYMLMPNTGASTIYTGDESESDLDLEYTSSIANKATIDFVYTGSSPNYGVFNAYEYAIQNQIGTVITISYGECEPDVGSSQTATYETYLKQAATQGQTIVNSSGDSGSNGCASDGTSLANQQQVAVSEPASSAYVTGVGGTEFPSADTASTNSTYFTAASGSDVIGSALSYIPEMVWNDDATNGTVATSGSSTLLELSAGGGGTSIYIARPSWQTGVPGIPSGNYRLVPDVALDASNVDAGYIYCTSDTGTGGIAFSGDCLDGFRSSNGTNLAVAGGTSFAAPIFASMVAIINQAKGYTSGQGLINPTLYLLASNAATYASAFHDITSGSNACTAGTTVCGSGANTTEYAAGVGYDEATGLGSVDLYKLIQAWPANTSPTSGLLVSNLSTTVNSYTPAVGTNDAITIQVTCASGTLCTGVAPTGKVTVTDTVNGANVTVTNSPVTLSSGAAIFTYAVPSTGGVHQLVLTYSGDSVYNTSKATIYLDVANAGFTISAPTVSVTAGSSVTQTVTIIPTNGYTGTVQINLIGVSTLVNACYTGPATVSITGTAAVTASYTITTSVSSCTNGALPLRRSATMTNAASNTAPTALPAAPRSPASPSSPWHSAPVPATLAGLLILGCFKRRSRLLRAGIALGFVVVLSFSGLALTGCGNGASGANLTPTTPTTGGTSYSVSITGNDSLDPAVAASTSFTLTVN